jgi:hypothetical protein
MNLDVHFMALLIVYHLLYNYFKWKGYIYICFKCYIECDALTFVEYIVLQSPTYMKALLSKHPFYIQLLSF